MLLILKKHFQAKNMYSDNVGILYIKETVLNDFHNRAYTNAKSPINYSSAIIVTLMKL